MNKGQLIQELNRCNQIKDYLMKISDILADGVNRVDKIHESIDRNCSFLNKYFFFKKDIIYNEENINNLLKSINEKIKRINISLNQTNN